VANRGEGFWGLAACPLRRSLVRAFGGVLGGVLWVEVQRGVVSPMVVKFWEHGEGEMQQKLAGIAGTRRRAGDMRHRSSCER